MDAELKKKWVAALRSGDYKQGRKRLRSADNKFCCLGVLCDVQGRHWRISTHFSEEYSIGAGEQEDTGGEENLKLIKDVGGRGIISDLININDGTGDHPAQNFKEIAQYIEDNL